jgi:uncharacterized membrane protein YgdD (TMEM256/DUF423 family)
MRALIVAAAACGLLLVVLGAATGHNSAPPPGGDLEIFVASWMQEAERQDRLNTILLFGFVHVLSAIAAASLPFRSLLATVSGWAFLAGVAMFSGGLTAGMLLADQGGMANVLAKFVPVGGLAFMAGWILLMAAVLLKQREA